MVKTTASKRKRPASTGAVAQAWLRSMWGGIRDRHHFADVEAFCLFIGYPRSGHSVLASLLSAHPDIVISHEIDALRYVRMRFHRQQIYHLILQGDRDFTSRGREVKTGFRYAVPDEWQGQFRQLRVIGDKRGGSSTDMLDYHPEVLDRLRRIVAVPLRILHVVRNPFDNIATISARSQISLEEAMSRYFRRCEAVSRIKARTHGELLDTSHESLIADPRACLSRVCDFVGVDASESYLTHCAEVVYPSPSPSRWKADWSEEHIGRVSEWIERYPFLKGYSYRDEEA